MSNVHTMNATLRADVAAAIAHRGCCGSEHDPQNGKLHGYCVVCGVPWPCDTAKYFLRAPLSDETTVDPGFEIAQQLADDPRNQR